MRDKLFKEYLRRENPSFSNPVASWKKAFEAFYKNGQAFSSKGGVADYGENNLAFFIFPPLVLDDRFSMSAGIANPICSMN